MSIDNCALPTPGLQLNLLFVCKFMGGHDLGLASLLTCGQSPLLWWCHCSSFLFMAELCCMDVCAFRLLSEQAEDSHMDTGTHLSCSALSV